MKSILDIIVAISMLFALPAKEAMATQLELARRRIPSALCSDVSSLFICSMSMCKITNTQQNQWVEIIAG